MEYIHFTVPGTPQGKARARTYYNPRIGRSVSHTPENTVLYENLIKMCYQSKAEGPFGDVPLSVCVHAYFQPAKAPQRESLPICCGA